MITLATRLYADTEGRRTWSDDDYQTAIAYLHQERLVNTAKAIAVVGMIFQNKLLIFSYVMQK